MASDKKDREALRRQHEEFVRALVGQRLDGERAEGGLSQQLDPRRVRVARMALFRKRMRGLAGHCPGLVADVFRTTENTELALRWHENNPGRPGHEQECYQLMEVLDGAGLLSEVSLYDVIRLRSTYVVGRSGQVRLRRGPHIRILRVPGDRQFLVWGWGPRFWVRER